MSHPLRATRSSTAGWALAAPSTGAGFVSTAFRLAKFQAEAGPAWEELLAALGTTSEDSGLDIDASSLRALTLKEEVSRFIEANTQEEAARAASKQAPGASCQARAATGKNATTEATNKDAALNAQSKGTTPEAKQSAASPSGNRTQTNQQPQASKAKTASTAREQPAEQATLAGILGTRYAVAASSIRPQIDQPQAATANGTAREGSAEAAVAVPKAACTLPDSAHRQVAANSSHPVPGQPAEPPRRDGLGSIMASLIAAAQLKQSAAAASGQPSQKGLQPKAATAQAISRFEEESAPPARSTTARKRAKSAGKSAVTEDSQHGENPQGPKGDSTAGSQQGDGSQAAAEPSQGGPQHGRLTRSRVAGPNGRQVSYKEVSTDSSGSDSEQDSDESASDPAEELWPVKQGRGRGKAATKAKAESKTGPEPEQKDGKTAPMPGIKAKPKPDYELEEEEEEGEDNKRKHAVWKPYELPVESAEGIKFGSAVKRKGRYKVEQPGRALPRKMQKVQPIFEGDSQQVEDRLRQAFNDSAKELLSVRASLENPYLHMTPFGARAEGKPEAVAALQSGRVAPWPNELPLRKDELILRVEIREYDVHHNTLQELLVPGCQKMVALRNAIHCPADRNLESLGMAVKGAFFFIEGTFYVDTRGGVDYVTPIRKFCALHGIAPPPEVPDKAEAMPKTRRAELDEEQMPPCTQFKQMDIERVTWNEIGLRVGPGAGNIFCHQGCCEHLLVIKDVRLIHRDDSHYLSAYPVIVRMENPYFRSCDVCHQATAQKVTYDDRHAPQVPAFWCKDCYVMMHYDCNNTLLYDHKVFPYHSG